jgi:hypothetical protein
VVCGECGSSLLKPMQWRNAIRDSEMLDRTAKLVCFVISTYMNGKGVAYPGKETIARGAGLGKGRRSVDGAIDRAEVRAISRSRAQRAAGRLGTRPPLRTSQGMRRRTSQRMRRWKTQRRIWRQPTSHGWSFNVAVRATEVERKRKARPCATARI